MWNDSNEELLKEGYIIHRRVNPWSNKDKESSTTFQTTKTQTEKAGMTLDPV